MNDDKSIDYCIAELHLQRALRKYRSSKTFIAVVIMPGDTGAGDWEAASKDLLDALAKENAPSDDDDCSWQRAGLYDNRVDIFQVDADHKSRKSRSDENDPWSKVTFGHYRSILICRRRHAEKVLGSRLSAIADTIVDIKELDLALVRRAIETVTGADVGEEEAAEVAALPAEIRAVLRRTGRGIRKVLDRLRSAGATHPPENQVPIEASPEGPRLEDLHGYGEAKVWGLELARDIADYQGGAITWADVDSGLLLSGPPGVGKTTFAQALANTCGVELIVGSYAMWQSQGHQGDMLKAMRRCFEAARAAAPCILLVDEVDAFIDRDRQHDNGEYMRGVVNGFLELLDGAKDRDGVVVIGACNNPAGIDPAVTRSGRLDRHIRIAHPDAAARAHILRYHLQSDLDVSSLMRRTEGFSGADLERLARDARRLARRQRLPVQIDHVIAALPQTRLLNADEIRASALHEIGHAVVAVILGHRHLNKVVISKELPTRPETAVTSIGHAHFSSVPARRVRSWYEDEICVMLASIAAETVFLGCHDDGAADDLAQATQAAVLMLSIAGFGASLVSDAGRDNTFWRHRQEAEIDAILREQLQRAAGIVEEHRDVIEHLAKILAQAGELDGAVVRHAVAQRNPLEPAFTA